MTDRKPPQGPPPIPPLGSYHPSEERSEWQPDVYGEQESGRPQQPAYHDLDRELTRLSQQAAQHSASAPQQARQPYPPQPGQYAPALAPQLQQSQPNYQPAYANAPPQPSNQAPPGAHHAQGQHPHQAQPPMRPPAPPHQHHRRPPPPSGGGFGILRFVLLLLFALVVIAVAGSAYFLFALPPDFVRDQVTSQVKAKTGRDLVIAGPTSFTLYPSVGISMGDVTLSPPPGMTGKPLVTMAKLEASVALMPLLKREIRVERLVLQKPVFELYTDAKGRKSWEFADAGNAAGLVRLAQAEKPVSDAPGGLPAELPAQSGTPAGATSPASKLEHFELGDVRIVDGAVRYADAATGTEQQASAINVRLGLAALNQPLTAKGDLAWKGEKINFDGEMNSVKAVMEDRPAKVTVNLSSAPLAARFNGSVIVRDGVETDGAIDAKSPSLRALAKWLGTVLPAARGFGPLEAKGQVRTTAKTIALSNAIITLDGAKATGQVTIETSGERPHVNANLQLSELDLNKYMRPEGTPVSQPAPAKAKPKPAAAPPKDAAKPKSIEDLLGEDPAKPATKVQGYTQRSGWSSEAIDFNGLGLVDADAKLSVGRLLFEDIKVGQSQLTIALKNRILKTNFDEIQLYGGRGRGFITIDGTAQKSATIGANMAVEGLDALPFLKDAADFDKLSGKAKLTLAVAGQGANQLQLVETLNGKADFVFTDGAVNGINVPGMVRGISQGKLSGLGASPSEKTDFSELGSTWAITNGVAQNQDLHLNSPLLRVTGAGSVTLPARQVDYMMRPKLVSSLSGQGGKDESGLEIPVRVHGSWDKLSYSPDLSGIMKDPNKALDQIKEIGKSFKGKDANEIVKGLLGGSKGATQPAPAGSGQAPAQPQQQQKLDPKALLNDFLKKQ